MLQSPGTSNNRKPLLLLGLKANGREQLLYAERAVVLGDKLLIEALAC